jgi:hypothetical protein
MILMSLYKAQATRDVLAGERDRTLAMAVRKRASSIYSVGRAFEEVGCSCSPYRDRLRELDAEYKTEQQRLLESLEKSELARELYDLRQKVAEIDRQEHPSLDIRGREAYPFLAVWLLDQVREGDGDIVGLSDYEISKAYAQAWIGGWRPRARSRQRRSDASAPAGPETIIR